jgi:drug/metabolite transporter (DMT)-like permease
MPHRVTLIDWFLLAGLVVCWGSSFAMSKVALAHVAPEWIAAARLAIGALILLAAAIAQGQLPPRRHLAAYGWLGLIGNAAPFFVITWGMQFISSGVAGLLMATIPLIIIVLAHFFLPGERLSGPRMAGFILGFIGIIVLMGPEKFYDLKSHGEELVGQLAVVAGCIMYGFNSISAKRFNLPGTVAIAAGVLLAGAVLATAAAAVQSPFTLHHAPPIILLALFGLGLFPTGIATVLWFKAVERTSPTFTAMSNYLVPIYALVFGALTLGEHIGWNVLVALLLVLAGIYVSRRRTGPKEKPVIPAQAGTP